MTRKDYELLARVLATFVTLESHDVIVAAFVEALAADNSQFNKQKFLKASDANYPELIARFK